MGSLLKAALIGARTVVEKSVGVVSLVLSSTKGNWSVYPSPAMTVLKDLIKVDFKKENSSIETGEAELENRDKEKTLIMFAIVNIVWIAIEGKTDSVKTIIKNELLFNKRL